MENEDYKDKLSDKHICRAIVSPSSSPEEYDFVS